MNQKRLFPFIVITSLFFLWGLAHNLNPILIPHLKKACQLSDLQSALIDSAFFVGYFTMALPAGFFMKEYGYKNGIILGLLMFAGGALLFVPAANTLMYGVFLFALFIIASGLTFLETAANPYIVALSEKSEATQRLNFAQSFNGLGATIAPGIGGAFILSGKTVDTSSLTSSDLGKYLQEEASHVKMPYIIIALIVLTVSFIVWRTHLPEIKEVTETDDSEEEGSVFKHKNLLRGVTAQFFYVGAQVCISSFFIRFLSTVGINEVSAAYYLSVALFCFMIGRFAGTLLMKYIAPAQLLIIYSSACILLLIVAIGMGGMLAVYCLIGVEFFMSIMFPTIFSLSIYGLGKQTKLGSSLLVMAIAGGAILPVIMGQMSDLGGIRYAYWTPAFCFLFVIYFALKSPATEAAKLAVSTH